MEGQAVRVTAGPLAEAVGELVRLDKSGRVRVLPEIMGGRVLATVESLSRGGVRSGRKGRGCRHPTAKATRWTMTVGSLVLATAGASIMR